MPQHAASPTGEGRGYTLIELMIVVVLLGVAGALLVPHIVARDSFRVQSAVRQLIGDLTFAQSDALAHQERRRVHFYADGTGYCIIRVDATTYATPWVDFNPDDIEYISDPIARSGDNDRYIIDFSADSRFEGVQIADVRVDGGSAGPEGDIVYDPLGGTLRPGDVPGTGGTITIVSGEDAYDIDLAPFTGKLTVSH